MLHSPRGHLRRANSRRTPLLWAVCCIFMKFVEYLVGLVLKGWHLALTEVLHLDASQAWVWSLFLLVVTVRGLLIPLMYHQQRSSRLLANVRPDMDKVAREYKGVKDKKKLQEMRARRDAIRKESGYTMRAGCLPALIQIPVVMGLYRLLLHVARPPEGVGAQYHSSFGPLTGRDISTFLDAEFLGVPIPAYMAMSQDKLAALNTTHSAVMHLGLPLVIMATVFTAVNMIISIWRMTKTMDHSSKAAKGMMRFIVIVVILVVPLPLFMSLKMPFPIAILMYWVTNNLWTLASSNIIQWVLNYTTPYTDEFWEHAEKVKRENSRTARKERKRKQRQAGEEVPNEELQDSESAEPHKQELQTAAVQTDTSREESNPVRNRHHRGAAVPASRHRSTKHKGGRHRK